MKVLDIQENSSDSDWTVRKSNTNNGTGDLELKSLFNTPKLLLTKKLLEDVSKQAVPSNAKKGDQFIEFYKNSLSKLPTDKKCTSIQRCSLGSTFEKSIDID